MIKRLITDESALEHGAETMASISMRRVQKAYGDHAPVIRDVDLEIGAHGSVFLGPSGCGKSTLLRMIAAEDLSAGELSIDAAASTTCRPPNAASRCVPELRAVPHMTVYENMAFGLKARARAEGRDRPEGARCRAHPAARHAARSQAEGAVGRTTAARRDRPRNRARAGVFLFDEPLSNLDAALRGQTRIEIAKLHRQFERASVVYVTHDQTEAMTLADKIVLLHAGADTAQHGSIAQVGAPLDLYHHRRAASSRASSVRRA